MADLAQVEDAFLKAHQAGDTEAAFALAGEVRHLRAAAQTAADEKLYSPTSGMTGTEKFLSGAGKAFTDIGRGAAQIVGQGPSPEEVAAMRQRDAPLMATGIGLTGNIAGNVAASLPTLAIPGVNTYVGAGLLGAGMGALQPVQSNLERLANAGIGGASGVVGQGLGNLVSRVIQPVQSALPPEAQALASAATREGIPLRLSQATGSKPLAITESVLENLPLTSAPQLATKQAQTEAFNRAVLSRAGIKGTTATPDILATQRAAVGGALGDIAERNALDFNKGLMTKLADITDNASKHLPPEKASQIGAQVDQILSQVDKNGVMAGTNYQGWREPLRLLGLKGDEYSTYYKAIKNALDTAFRDQIPGAEGEMFRDLSRKYANLKVITKAMGGSSPEQIVGNIPPSQLAGALAQSVGREGKALGRGDLNELVRVGRKFVSPNIPDSGTAQRAMIQAALQSGGGSIVGGLGAAATGNDPLKGAGYGLAAGTGAVLAPRVVQAIMQNPALMSYIIHQSKSPAAQTLAAVLQNSGRTLGASAAPTLQTILAQ